MMYASTPHVRSPISIKELLSEKLFHPSAVKMMRRLLKMALTERPKFPEDRQITALEAYAFLGKATFTLGLMQEINKIIQDNSSPRIHQTPVEIGQLQEQSIREISLCTQYVRALLRKELEDPEEKS